MNRNYVIRAGVLLLDNKGLEEHRIRKENGITDYVVAVKIVKNVVVLFFVHLAMPVQY
jgi:hypothetical protein